MLTDNDIIRKMNDRKKKIFVHEIKSRALFKFKRGSNATMRRQPSDWLQRYEINRYYDGPNLPKCILEIYKEGKSDILCRYLSRRFYAHT